MEDGRNNYFLSEEHAIWKNDRLKTRFKSGKTLSDRVKWTSVGTRCPGLLTSRVQTHRLGEVRHQQAVDNEPRRVLRMKRPLASPGGRHAASMLTDPSEAQSSPCRTPGFFRALCWSSAGSRRSLGSWTTSRWPERDEGKVKRDAAVETHCQWTSSCSCSCLVVKPVTWSQVDSLDSTSAKPWPNTWWQMSSHFLLH